MGCQMAKMLITGGAGFIGTNLARELRSRGHEVRTIDIKPFNDPLHDRIDVTYYQQLEAYFKKFKFDYVYHLAAEYGRWNGEDHYQNLWQVNVIGLKNMLRLQEIHRFKMISFSSAEVYGDFEEIMIAARNKVMSERASKILAEGNAFIAVGALHLPGEKGLVEMFRKSGYSVTALAK